GGINVPPGLISVEDNEGETSKQWTQEIRLNGGNKASRLNWVVGLYGLADSVDRFANVPIRYSPTAPVSPGLFLDRAWKQNAHSKSAAIFGQATYEFLPGASLTLGGRYTYDRKAIDQFYRQGATTIYNYKDLHKSWERFTGRVTLDWKPTRDLMLYATYSQGYKSGVFISQSTSGPAASTPLDPEEATNWEAGFKSQLLDRHVQLNVTVFDLTVKNLQLFRLSGLTLVSENSDAKVKGLEGDLQIVPVKGLRFSGSLSLLDPKYSGGTFNGKYLARAPKWKYTLGADYTHYLANDAELSFNASYASTAGYFMESTNVRVSFVDQHSTLDASVKYVSPNKMWDLSVWGKNLTDELIERHSIVGTFGGSTELYMPPRTFGVTANVKF
ncbi:MAG: TonB-dependent receptor, partial [Proteobacteria bacterium]|nr:TonB-dependent receptor [Pseudomonadota bacterium]